MTASFQLHAYVKLRSGSEAEIETLAPVTVKQERRESHAKSHAQACKSRTHTANEIVEKGV